MSYQPPPENYTYSPPNSSTAIISLIAGILGLTLIPIVGSIVAVITASMAKNEIAQSNGALGGEGMATAGAVLGWIGIALFILGFCLVGFVFVVPLCLGLFYLSAEGVQLFLPGLISLFF